MPIYATLKRGRTSPSRPATSLTSVHTAPHRAAIRRILRSTGAQPKLTIGSPNDKYEQEADRVADRIMRMPDQAVSGISKGVADASIQRTCAACSSGGGPCAKCAGEEPEILQTKPLAGQITPLVQRQVEEQDDELLQSKTASGTTPEVTPSLAARIGAMKGGGQLLPESSRNFFEPRFGNDFSQVRIHTGGQASESAQAVNARAFTIGRDVVFGSGQYAPGTAEGQRLLAHELTHVVQQNGTRTPPLQRLTEVEKVENLKSLKYAGNNRLERAFDDDPPLTIGESNEPVLLVQEGLVAEGYPMPASTKPTGELDGVFGEETFRVVKVFQSDNELSVDGIVGRRTMGKLDERAQGSQPGQVLPQVLPSITPGGGFPECVFVPSDASPDKFQKLAAEGFSLMSPESETKELTGQSESTQGFQWCRGGNGDKCINEKKVSTEKDPLPPPNQPIPIPVPPKQMLPLLNKIIDQENSMAGTNQPKHTRAPLGFTKILTPGLHLPNLPGIKVRTESIPGSLCKKCVADWNLQRPPIMLFFMSPGFSAAESYVVDGKRFFVTQEDVFSNRSGCNSKFGTLLEVRNVISLEVVPRILIGELEHWLDAQRAFDLTGGRHLANVRRLTADRTHLRGKDQKDCEARVAEFLDTLSGTPGLRKLAGVETFLKGYGGVYLNDFRAQYESSGQIRDRSGQHTAILVPPKSKKPFFPNIDREKNPFGCEAYWRKITGHSLPGIPGPNSETVIVDLNTPPKEPWHPV